MRVVLGSRDLVKGETVARSFRLNERTVFARQLDVTDQQSIDRLLRDVTAEFGRLDVLVLHKSNSGRIVNVSSESGSIMNMKGGTPAYSVSKAALNALTCILAAELSGTGILVNAICPGWVATDMGAAGGRPVSDGALSIVWATILPADDPTGGYFRDGNGIPW